MSKGKTVEMKRFKIISLDYRLEPGYEGNLAVEQKIHFELPTSINKEKTTLYGEYELNITGDGDKEFHFNIVGRGKFKLGPDQMEKAIEMEPSVMDPMVDKMRDKLVQLVSDITSLFGITPIELEVTNGAEE